MQPLFYVKMIGNKMKEDSGNGLLKDKKYKDIYAEVSDVGSFCGFSADGSEN